MTSTLWRLGKRHPVLFGMAITGAKTSTADVIAQVVIQQRAISDINWRRNAVFGLFGTCYLGCFAYFLYVPCFKAWFPRTATFASLPLRQKLRDRAGLRQLGGQLAIDQFLHIPLLYYPVFYVLKEGVETGTVSTMTARTGLRKYAANAVPDNIAQWCLWIPAQAVNFAICPMWLRVPFVAGVSFCWTIYLSLTRGDPDNIDDESIS